MAYDVRISGTTYTGIENVQIPLAEGGNVTFADGNALTALCNGTITNANLGNEITSLRGYAFQNCASLVSVSAPNVYNVGAYAFQGCTSLTTLDFWDKMTVINQYSFQGCTGLTGVITLPVITGVTATNAFQGCTGITKFVMGWLDGQTNRGPGTSFKGCTSLTTFDAGEANYIGNSAFEGCTALNTLILRRTAGIVNLANTTPFLNGTSAVNVYVPSALKSAYQADSKWSAQSAVTFVNLEGSPYA